MAYVFCGGTEFGEGVVAGNEQSRRLWDLGIQVLSDLSENFEGRGGNPDRLIGQRAYCKF